MKKTTSIIILLTIGLYILFHMENSPELDSTNSGNIAVLEPKETNIHIKDVNAFVIRNHSTTLKYVADDDREL